MNNSILAIDEVIKLTRLSKTTIYGLIKQGQFPVQIKISARRSGWSAQEIDDWIQQRADARQGGNSNA